MCYKNLQITYGTLYSVQYRNISIYNFEFINFCKTNIIVICIQ